jgi:hypothetical protein
VRTLLARQFPTLLVIALMLITFRISGPIARRRVQADRRDTDHDLVNA